MIGIAVAGALGAVARYGLDELIGRHTGSFPWGIFVVNVTGAFLIGFMVEALEPRFEDSWVRAAVVTGFLGAYTTFSTFIWELLALTEGRSMHREQVMDALWPELSVDAAGPRLHKAAHYARRALGDQPHAVQLRHREQHHRQRRRERCTRRWCRHGHPRLHQRRSTGHRRPADVHPALPAVLHPGHGDGRLD